MYLFCPPYPILIQALASSQITSTVSFYQIQGKCWGSLTDLDIRTSWWKMQFISGCVYKQGVFIQVPAAKGFPEEKEDRFYSFR